jgi:hypothetical protein
MRHDEEMTVPSAVIDQEFIETWAKRYRCGAENSPWRPGPKMTAVISDHPELNDLSGLTTYWDFEEHIFNSIGPDLQRTDSYSLPHFLTVGYWKTPRQLSNYRKNDEAKVRDVTSRAFDKALPSISRPATLTALDGVQVPVASALLTVWNPNEFTIIDVWALKTLSFYREGIDGVNFAQHGQPWWEQHYDVYLRACLAIAERVKPLTLRDVDRALWKWGQ